MKIFKDEQSMQMRVQKIKNGYLVKAGGEPLFCATLEGVMDEACALVEEFGDAYPVEEEKKG